MQNVIISRRSLLAASMLSSSACARGRSDAMLRARPGTGSAATAGLRGLKLRKNRDTLFYVPRTVADSAKPAPFLIYLHGAGGSEQQGIRQLGELADSVGFILLSPASEGGTWDAIRDGYGPDVRALDDALTKAFESCSVSRVGVCGFSDGASYALGLGLSNGQLFKSVMAFSPGFIPLGGASIGTPHVFISHGTQDEILPIETCSRRIVPDLKRHGYEVTYREFAGRHTVPRDAKEEAVRWFIG